MTTHWAEVETSSAKLNDSRLTNRLKTLLEHLGQSPKGSIYSNSPTLNDAINAYRFFDNPKVNPEAILSGHVDASVERAKGNSHVLLVQDTTFLEMTRGEKKSNQEKRAQYTREELPLHLSVLLGADRDNLGVIKASFHKDFVKERRSQSQKESQGLVDEVKTQRWLEHNKEANELQRQLGETTVIQVADREGDLYDLYHQYEAQPTDARAEILVRLNQTKRHVINEEGENDYLVEHLERLQPKGKMEIACPKRGNKPARVATVVVTYDTLTFWSQREPNRQPVTVSVVHAEELNTSVDDPIQWTLVSTLAVEAFEQAQTLIGWYAQRWEIEVYFRVLKQCCKAEDIKLHNYERLTNAIAVYLIIAWKIHFITMNARRYPNEPATLCFTEREWKTIYTTKYRCPPPQQIPKLRDITRALAFMGGFKGRKGDGEPGVEVISRGYEKLLNFFDVYDAIS